MLTFKRAILIALAVVTLIYLLRPTQSDHPARIRNADDLPKPKGVHTTLHEDEPKEPGPEAPTSTSVAMPLPHVPPPPPRKPTPQISLEDMRSRPLAQQLEIPIVPVTIPYNWIILPPNEFLLRWKPIHVIFHEPIDPAQYSMDNIDSLKKKVREVIETELKQHLPK